MISTIGQEVMSEDIFSGTSNYKVETVDSSKGVNFLKPST